MTRCGDGCTVKDKQLNIVLLSIHGLIRGHDLELGRDADTGGQTKYVVELARALGQHSGVGRVDLMTRRVSDPQVSDDYARPFEELGDTARIVRIDCGEEGYLPKEQLWDTLDNFVDNAMQHLRDQDDAPHLIHSHYADAGYVGVRLAGLLGIPLVHTGHSLGRVKRRRLLASGLTRDQIESRYNMSRRIGAEEATLGAADLVITSTQQEVESQYGLYDYYRPDQMEVVPPGVDLERFFPPEGDERQTDIYGELRRFLVAPEKPLILALSRPDRRKNINALVAAYGQSPELQGLANLVVVAGNRDDIGELEDGAQQVLTDLLLAIDRFDLYGRVAYPKQHRPEDVSLLYRLAALSQGVFANTALTEPFGLTLLEAAASGLPVVATDDGGPTDIIENCRHGYLVDPLDTEAIGAALLKALNDPVRWRAMARSGPVKVRRLYSWSAHTEAYLEAVRPLITAAAPVEREARHEWSGEFRDRAIFSDLDRTLIGDAASLATLVELIKANRKRAAFGIVTGRRLNSALSVLRKHGIPRPDVLITSLGTDIYYAPNLTRDTRWREHIDHLWNPRAIRRLLADLPGLKRQPLREQGAYKLSYYYDPAEAPTADELNSLLRQHEQSVNLFVSFGQFLDVVPIRASKGAALRWYSDLREVPLRRILVAGGSGADEDTMRGNTLAVVVANRHDEELSELADIEHIFFAEEPQAAGILAAIEHYDFFGACRSRVP
jgi:sucrose-phosphate synthase